MTRRIAMVTLLALAGCAGTPEQSAQIDRDVTARELARATEGMVAGTPQRCVGGINLQGPQVIGPDTVIYRDAGRTYVSRAEGCPASLYGQPILIVERNGTQLCQNDRFRTLHRGGGAIPGPVCRFGAFTPYSKPN